jgi:hypothetical protein
MTRSVAALVVAAVSWGFAAFAHAQVIYPGSTIQGDYLRGVGIAAAGMGVYNYDTAVANRINTGTVILWNEYVSAVAQYQSDKYWRRRKRIAEQRNQYLGQILDRVRNRPEYRDIQNGDSLNDALKQLLNPAISPSSYRSRPVPLSTDVVRRIPFKHDKENLVFSMHRITAQGKDKWPPALQDPAFASERRAYERALDAVLEEQIEGQMNIATIRRLDGAVDMLIDKLDQVLVPSREKLYLEAKNRLTEFKKAAQNLFESHSIQLAMGDLDRYAGSNVHDLVVFMQNHKLGFAPAGTPEERELYPVLYASLLEQLDLVRSAVRESPK